MLKRIIRGLWVVLGIFCFLSSARISLGKCTQCLGASPAPPDEPKPPCQACLESCTGSPCFLGSGAYTTSSTDLSLPGVAFPVEATRFYNSARLTDGLFGIGWVSSFSAALYYGRTGAAGRDQNEAAIRLPDGGLYLFIDEGDDVHYDPPNGRFDTLIHNGDGSWDLTIQRSRTVYHFDNQGRLLTRTDDYGNQQAWTYNGSMVNQITDVGSGRSLLVAATLNGRITSILQDAYLPAGRRIDYGYDTNAGTLTSYTDAAGRVTQLGYTQGRFGPLLSSISLVMPDNSTRQIASMTYTYDNINHVYPSDRLTQYTQGGETYTLSLNVIPPRISGATVVKEADHSGFGFVFETLPPFDQIVAKYPSDQANNNSPAKYTTYDANGLVLTTTQEMSSHQGDDLNTCYTYDGLGHILTVTRDCGGPDQVTFTYSYAESNNPDKVTAITPSSVYWQGWAYDYYGRSGEPDPGPAPGALHHVYRIENDGTTRDTLATYTYDSSGRVLSFTAGDGGETDYAYDGSGNLHTVTSPSNNDARTRPVVTYAYDVSGRVTGVTDALGNATSYTYDMLDRVLSVTLPKPSPSSTLNFATTYAYDQWDSAAGFRYTLVTDANGLATKQEYDEFGHLVKTVDALSFMTTYTYSNDLLTQIADGNGNITQYAYAFSDPYTFHYNPRALFQITYPDGYPNNVFEQFHFYPDGSLQDKRDANAATLSYAYDHFGRLIHKIQQSTQHSIDYTYTGQLLTAVEDNISSPSGAWSYTYDPSYRVASDQQSPGGALLGEMDYTYSGADRIATATVRGGASATYAYYPDGSVDTIQWSPITSGQFKYTYLLTGQYQSATVPSGQTRTYSYDNQGRLGQVQNALGSSNLATYAYGYDYDYGTGTYDRLGQRTSQTATVPAQGFSNALSKYYYDSNYQLTRADYPNGSPFNGESDVWAYDGIGNRLSASLPSGLQNYTYYLNANNTIGQRLHTITQNGSTLQTFQYSNAGSVTENVVSPTTYDFSWDYEQRMTSITSGGQPYGSYGYDYQGRRWKKTLNGSTTTNYLYSGLNLVHESGATTADYLYGPGIDEPVAMMRGGKAYYFDVDGLGSVALVNNAGGTVQDNYVYDAWGQARTQTGSLVNLFGYTAREFGEAGLDYYRARYYNPGVGRFNSLDAFKSRSWRESGLYSYAENSPLMYVDPSGNVIKECFRPLIGHGTPLIGGSLAWFMSWNPVFWPIPGAKLCPMHAYLFNTDTGTSEGFGTTAKETGKQVTCWTIPEPLGSCMWNRFPRTSPPETNYNGLYRNCQDAINNAARGCLDCPLSGGGGF